MASTEQVKANDKTDETSTSSTDNSSINEEITKPSTQTQSTEDTHAQSSSVANDTPKEERKGFFARLFNL